MGVPERTRSVDWTTQKYMFWANKLELEIVNMSCSPGQVLTHQTRALLKKKKRKEKKSSAQLCQHTSVKIHSFQVI